MRCGWTGRTGGAESADAIVEELRLLCGDEAALIEQRTALVNQLQAALHEYYPAALEAFEDWTAAYTWAFIEAFPTPQRLVQSTAHRRRVFLHTHQLWRPGTASEGSKSLRGRISSAAGKR